MPYKMITCKACGHDRRVMQKPNDPPVVFCSRECSLIRWGQGKVTKELQARGYPSPQVGLQSLYVERQMTIGAIAIELGVGHRTIKNALTSFGIPLRSIAEQKAIDMRKMSLEDRLQMTAASRALITGKKRSHDDLCKRARGRQRGAKLSADESEILSALNAARLNPIPLFAIDKYNIDFAFPECRVAVEYNGGNYHNTPSHVAGDRIKADLLEAQGWRLLVFPRLARPRQRDSGNVRIELSELVSQVRDAVHLATPLPEQCEAEG